MSSNSCASRNYNVDIVNLKIQATAVALKINIFIYQENKGDFQILRHHGRQESLDDIHLKCTCHPWFENCNHYDVMVISSGPGSLLCL